MFQGRDLGVAHLEEAHQSSMRLEISARKLGENYGEILNQQRQLPKLIERSKEETKEFQKSVADLWATYKTQLPSGEAASFMTPGGPTQGFGESTDVSSLDQDQEQQKTHSFIKSLKTQKTHLQNYVSDAQNLYQQVQLTAVSSMHSIENALVRTAQTGKLQWKDMVNSMLADMSRLVIRDNVTGPLSSIISTGLTSMFNPVQATAGTNYMTPIGPTKGYATGGVLPEDIMGFGKSGQSYKLHKDETVVPAGQDQPAVENHFHITVHAIDSRSLQETMNRNPNAVLGPFKKALASGDRDLRSIIRGV